MAIFDLFSKRQRRLRGDIPDIYTYDDLPNELRVQIVYIWLDALSRYAKVLRKCRDMSSFRLWDTKTGSV